MRTDFSQMKSHDRQQRVGRGSTAVGAATLRRRWADLSPAARALLALAAASCGWLLVCLILQAFDGRQVLGVSTWVKPAKFAASIAVTSATLAWLLPFITLSPRALARVGAIIVAMFSLELVIITAQAARGVPSHFNNATLADGVAFSVMGVGIVVATLALAFVGARALRQRFADPALGWGIRFGFVALLLGSAVGGVMPRPTADQLTSLGAGRGAPLLGAHTVGVPDGGPGLPVVGWSTVGGDLRVAHFLGLHGFQVLPLFGWAVGRRSRAAGGRDGAATVAIVGLGYLGLTVVLLAQALRGQPLLRPDAGTWMSVAGVLAVMVLATATGVVTPRAAGDGAVVNY